jgi:hypothetical protein
LGASSSPSKLRAAAPAYPPLPVVVAVIPAAVLGFRSRWSLKLAAKAATFRSRGAKFIKESQMSIGLVGIIIEQKNE